jgi:ribulose-phosphate 3-epimerase
VKVAPSVIAADFSKFQEEIKRAEEAGADLLHLDIMDGVFVPNITFGPMIVEAIDMITDMELDAHLMIVRPENYLTRFIDAGADWISFHAEASEKIDDCLKIIRERGKKVGLAISPPTPFTKVKQYLERLDFLLLMTVNPGFYGQEFISDVLRKIEEAKEWIMQHKVDCLIQVDGGINCANAPVVCEAGVDIVVAGASVFKSDDYRMAIEELRCSKV